jgi:hypothetical protein
VIQTSTETQSAALELSSPAPQPRSSTRLPGSDPDLLSHIFVLSPLGVLQADREVAVVLGAAEVCKLTHAQPKDAVGERVGEVDVVAISHTFSASSPLQCG